MNQDKTSEQPGVIQYAVPDNQALYRAYMPFIRNGGLFVPASCLQDIALELETEVFLHLHLVEQDEHLSVIGRVVWVSHLGSRYPSGIGLQFAELDGIRVRQRIETLLAGHLESNRSTDTL